MSIIQTFMGRTGGRVNLTDRSIGRNVNNFSGAEFSIQGQLAVSGSDDSVAYPNIIAGEWFTELDTTVPFVGDNYEVRLTVVTGVAPGGMTPGSWLRLNNARNFGAFNLAGSVYLIEIRPFGGTTILGSATFTMI
ncbi:MAG: hypothetical protein ACK5NX_01320 [Armatimonadota bacterium]